ncbi:hypothetical protein G6F22_018472 [Rhizopus arrhizus]|nr:hypothetical protein G6F22_018472 [Rhizopus arrhizus]
MFCACWSSINLAVYCVALKGVSRSLRLPSRPTRPPLATWPPAYTGGKPLDSALPVTVTASSTAVPVSGMATSRYWFGASRVARRPVPASA